jgi:hypothetical protein
MSPSVCCLGRSAFAFSPFPSYEDRHSRSPGAVNPERSEPEGRVDGEDDRINFQVRERGSLVNDTIPKRGLVTSRLRRPDAEHRRSIARLDAHWCPSMFERV